MLETNVGDLYSELSGFFKKNVDFLGRMDLKSHSSLVCVWDTSNGVVILYSNKIDFSIARGRNAPRYGKIGFFQ
jgi:hypothetical protein